MSRRELPIGRRVAQWRVRLGMSQQVFADRLGKSKSWVDKVERGVRSLDRVSTIADVAAVLGIDRAVLLGRDAQPADAAVRASGVSRIRAALSTYEVAVGRPASRMVPIDQLTRSVAHAWSTYQYARYPQLVGLLPSVLVAAQRTNAHDPRAGGVPLVEACRVAASVLVKIGETDLAWLAADRAMTVAAGNRLLVAAAAVQLGQVLRASGRARLAERMLCAAAYRIGSRDLDAAAPAGLSLRGTLLVQAALAAARSGEGDAAGLLDEAADLADRIGDGHDHHRTGFGPTAVESGRTAAAVESGDAEEAVIWHQKTTGRDGWRWLPAEHRAAHLVDAARAYLQLGDLVEAGRILVEADRIAPVEIRCRPAVRDLVAQVARHPHAPTTVTRLAGVVG